MYMFFIHYENSQDTNIPMDEGILRYYDVCHPDSYLLLINFCFSPEKRKFFTMNPSTPPADRAYGFDSVYSNVPLNRLEELWAIVEHADRDPDSGFSLRPGWNVLVVDLNRFHLRSMLEKITAETLREYTNGPLSETFTSRQEVGVRYPHHTSDTILYFFSPKNTDGVPDVELIYGRVKNRDSLTEKITREFAKKGHVHSEMVESAIGSGKNHLIVDDCYGVTFVCRDEELLYAVQRALYDSPYLHSLATKDFIAHPKPSGYRAVHEKLLFTDRENDTDGLLLEIHLETREDSYKNRYGNGEPHRAHYTYSMRKLTHSPHTQGNNQIIIFEKNGRDHEFIVPVNVGNRFAQYTLFNY
jgi:hypothetical protein